MKRETEAIGAAAMLAALWCGLAAAGARAAVSPQERQKIEAALPAKAVVPPRKPRKLLIFGLNVGYGGHGSIATANVAFARMGQKTGAFETVISRDPVVFRPENLKQFDAVFLNNTVGNLFEDPALRQSLIEFVYGGGGLLGVHGTSVAFTRWPGAHEDWPEFGLMLGARGASHREAREHVFIKLDDPGHPLNAPFGGKGFEYRDEFFRFHNAYSRHRVRVLFSIDVEKTDFGAKPSAAASARTTITRWPGCGGTAAGACSTAPLPTTPPCSGTRRCCGSTSPPHSLPSATCRHRPSRAAESRRPSAPRRSWAGAWASRPTRSTSTPCSRPSTRPLSSACPTWAA
ncbi:ThuA domain-containing protein [bacterium]|nr:ThuA domain-containing protein [bacterium]